MSQRFVGKVALVTGAGCVGPGWGNGRAIAAALAREGASCSAWTATPDSMAETAERIAAEGGRFEPATCDVTDGAAVARLVADAVARHGRDRRAGEQRRRLGRRRAGGDGGGGLGPPDRHQPEECLPDLQARDPGHGAAGRRRDRQPRLDLRDTLDRRGAGRLCGVESGRHQLSRVVAVQYAAKASG
jgi:NAD(P)-dependent dehydrogenase (short-subunit alcohol dehydrogenase family)